MDNRGFISLKELASKLDISYHSAYRLARAKGFPSYKIGGLWRVDIAKLDRWLAVNNEQKQYL